MSDPSTPPTKPMWASLGSFEFPSWESSSVVIVPPRTPARYDISWLAHVYPATLGSSTWSLMSIQFWSG